MPQRGFGSILIDFAFFFGKKRGGALTPVQSVRALLHIVYRITFTGRDNIENRENYI